MRNSAERQELLERVSELYPDGCTATKEMIQRLKEKEIWEIGVSRISLLTRKQGKQNFIVGYLATEYIDSNGEILHDPFEGNQILNHPIMERIQAESGSVLSFGRIDLGNHPHAGLIPGKISPLEISRLRMRTYRRSRHFFISTQTDTLANNGADIILPKNGTALEIMSLKDLLFCLKNDLERKNWDQVHIA